MGIPYSKQVNAAFDQVTPLVAAGFRVLQTTKNISILLATIQVLTVVLLGLIQATLLLLLITVNPDLQNERGLIATPIAKYFADWFIWWSQQRKPLIAGFWILVLGGIIGTGVGWYYTVEDTVAEGEAKTAEVQQAIDGDPAEQSQQ
ncbi:hypothetical protein K461DRAFT_42439 [Myriangium duriaei CBS 260.36]|uniref:Uncharacterized protein n=1 Tax=Myriangium duriaei CBS 260.36 TaxID=1168546 RepID=A0A9P4MDH2_9PEZI|nr:hypothetical protein K461DRAFT_42439 [Myriangium duriaei CBS 260.36]